MIIFGIKKKNNFDHASSQFYGGKFRDNERFNEDRKNENFRENFRETEHYRKTKFSKFAPFRFSRKNRFSFHPYVGVVVL
jgi:hypothetical protein